MDLLTLIEQFISQWWTIAVATLIIFSVYSWGIAPFRVLKNAFDHKVPGPTALPFIGNMLDAVRHKGQMHLQIDEYYKRYGDVFGMYLLGSLPTLVISDLDMVKEVFVKKFQAFRDRPDLLDVMLLAAQDPTLPDSKKMTVDEVLAQSVIFLIAGYETSSTTLGFVCYSLATNADIQEKLQKEIDSVWDDESKMPSYETVNELPYLDMVISETLRLYPAAPFSIRTCKEDCILKNLKVPLGISVTVPTYSIHRDPKLWPNPERFDPERFSPEAKQSRDPYAYMPFGHGPRNCIGMRFAQMEMKLMLVRILKKYSFHVSKDTKIPPEVTLRIALTAKEIKLLIKLRQ